MTSGKRHVDSEEYLLFPDFHPEQSKSDLQITQHLLKARMDRMRANLNQLNKIFQYQLNITNGRYRFKTIQSAGKKLGKMRRLSFNILRRFNRSASLALNLSFLAKSLSELQTEMNEWERI